MKKSLTFISLLLALLMLFASCSAEKTDETTVPGQDVPAGTDSTIINVGLLKGPTGMGAAKLMDDSANGAAKGNYSFRLEGAADVLQSALISGELDMAALPVNVVSVLNAKTEGKINILAVNTLGVLYVMSTEDIASVEDLRGKTVLSAGKGTTAEYAFDYILEKNGLTAGEDVNVEFASEHAEVISKAAAGGYDTVLLPEPFVTQMKMQNAGFSTVLDLTDEWEKLGGGLLTMGAIAVRKEFAEQHPGAVAVFLEEYAESVETVKADTENAALLIEKYDIAKAAVAKQALPFCNLTCMTGEEMKENVSAYLAVLADFNPAAVGGAVPGDSFYYIPENSADAK